MRFICWVSIGDSSTDKVFLGGDYNGNVWKRKKMYESVYGRNYFGLTNDFGSM